MWNEFLGNQILISAVLGWTVAQFLKTVIDMVINKSFRLRRNAEFPFSDGLCAYDGIRNEVRSGKL